MKNEYFGEAIVKRYEKRMDGYSEMMRENMKERINISFFMYFLFVLLTIYQDSPFSLIVGAAGYSFVMPMSIIVFFTVIIIDKFRIYYINEIKMLWILALWLVFSSILGIVIWKIFGNSLTVVGEFLPYKALKVWLQYISYPMYIYVIIRWLKHINNLDLVFKPIFVSLIIMTVLCLIEKTQIPNAFEWLHFAGVFPYYRIRLLTLESSATANIIFIYAGICMFYALFFKRRMTLLMTVICILILVTYTSSKTLLLSFILFSVIFIWLISKKVSRKRLLPIVSIGALLAIASVYYVLPNLSSYLSNDIKNYTSFITRAYTIVIGVCISIVFPFGVGCGAYLGFFQNALKKYVYLIGKLPIFFNTEEIELYANRNTDEALSVKSGLINFNLYWGILGMIVLISVFIRLYKKLKRLDLPYIDILKAVYITAIILTVIGNFGFETWLLISVVIHIQQAVINQNR